MNTPDSRSDMDDVSDGYHTFGELYAHRAALFIMLMMLCREYAWYSTKHHDGESIPGFFLAGLSLPMGQISYHLRESPWLDVLRESGLVTELPLSPPWDGHTSFDTITRLIELIKLTPAALKDDAL